MKLRIGLSTCPNDTFAFHGLLSGASDRHGLDADFALLDIQELNERLVRGDLDVAKASFAQALSLGGSHGVLPVGAAIGFGIGPLLVAPPSRDAARASSRAGAKHDERPDERSRVLSPGPGTTAFLLLRLLLPRATNVDHVRFDAILPAVARGEADFGVVIHEGRFTYQQHGVRCVADLGELWERRTRQPLPLGGLLARLDLGADVHRRVTAAVRASLDHARAHRDDAFATMRRHALELPAEAIWKHVELYVSDFTRELGLAGAAALVAFERAARESGLVERGLPPLAILRA